MNIGKKLISMILGVALLATAAAFIIPAYAKRHTTSLDAVLAGEANSFATAAASSVAVTPPVAQAVAPVAVAPVAVQAVVEQIVKPIRKTISKPKPEPKLEPKPEPRFETITRRACEMKTVTVDIDVPDVVKPVERSALGMILGGAAGALLGNQIGGGNGKTIATVAAAAGGAYAGDRVANSNEPAKAGTHKEQRQAQTEVCSDVSEQVRVN